MTSLFAVTPSGISYTRTWFSGPRTGVGRVSGIAIMRRKFAGYADGPLPLPTDWIERVHRAQGEAELAALVRRAVSRSVSRRAPFGEATWQRQAAVSLGLESSLR